MKQVLCCCVNDVKMFFALQNQLQVHDKRKCIFPAKPVFFSFFVFIFFLFFTPCSVNELQIWPKSLAFSAWFLNNVALIPSPEGIIIFSSECNWINCYHSTGTSKLNQTC